LTKIFIARHGNTFSSNQTVLRVGRRTDIPLSDSGMKQALKLGNYFKSELIDFAAVYTSKLQRTIETANIILQNLGTNISPITEKIFDEIDYGPDEGKSESEVVARLGREALLDWDKIAKVPTGWQVNVDDIKQAWCDFVAVCRRDFPTENVLVVTSNGIARFAPIVTGKFDEFLATNSCKLATGAVACLEYKNTWQVKFWNHLP